MKFTEYKSLELTRIAEEILQFWKDNDIFQKSIDFRNGKEPFIFYEGPPSANGLPGIHHVMARSLKDIFCRFHTQLGEQVFRKAGWDTHGLPVEIEVEKKLGLTSKKDIENYSNKNFNDDYEGISFSIEKAGILAVAKQFDIDIEKEKDNLAQVPSIFLIIKRDSDKKDGIEIDMLQDKIQIFLSKKDYEHYALLSKGSYQALLHSSIIFPALIYIFENLEKSNLETFQELNWFKTIKKVLNNIDIELDKDSLEREHSYNLAQKIINYPVTRSLEAMLSLENEEEEI